MKHIGKVKRGVKGAGRALPKGEGKGEGHVITGTGCNPDPLPVIIQCNQTMPRTTTSTGIPPKEEVQFLETSSESGGFTMTLIFVPSTVQKQPFSKQSTGKTTSSFRGTGMAFAMFASSSDGLVWFRLVDEVGCYRYCGGPHDNPAAASTLPPEKPWPS